MTQAVSVSWKAVAVLLGTLVLGVAGWVGATVVENNVRLAEIESNRFTTQDGLKIQIEMNNRLWSMQQQLDRIEALVKKEE